MRLSVKWQEVVLAQRVELDVSHQDHALVGLVEERPVDHVLDAGRVPLGQELEGLFHPVGSPLESFPFRVLPQLLEHLVHQGLERYAHRGGLGVRLMEAVQ